MIGTSFQPLTEEMLRKRLNRNQLGPLQSEALRILSLHLPQDLLSGRPIAPDDLLRPRVGGVDPGSGLGSGLSDLLNRALGGGTSASAPAPPRPVIIPGIGPGEPSPGEYHPGPVEVPPGRQPDPTLPPPRRRPVPRDLPRRVPRSPFPDETPRGGGPFGY